ncbi:MAG: peptide-methionine (S)-S-oxide reductase MsrA [Chlorobi bacterium]|nr:peptide-methionine (S)-S-oxide reductase MsrA [Chlorobiota bacterium]
MRNAFAFILPGILLFLSLTAYSQTEMKKNNQSSYDTATFGTGCFWCSEAIFKRLKGVVEVTPGYSGGEEPDPTYELVKTGTTRYAEVVQIVYDPETVSFSKLLEVFWKTHDPTTLNRQGADVGPQYRSVIFYHNDRQKQLAGHYKNELEKAGIWDKPVVTEISPFKSFFEAENYHKDYYKNNPGNTYCNFVITPKVEKFEKLFKNDIKKVK